MRAVVDVYIRIQAIDAEIELKLTRTRDSDHVIAERMPILAILANSDYSKHLSSKAPKGLNY
jgi:hypothetical protein